MFERHDHYTRLHWAALREAYIVGRAFSYIAGRITHHGTYSI